MSVKQPQRRRTIALRFLNAATIKRLVEALTPRFLGRDQDHLIALADEAAFSANEEMLDHTQPLFDFKDDIQGPGGAELVGILDLAGHFTGDNVEEALQELGALTGSSSGDLVQGAGIALTGDLTNRLVGVGDIEIAANNVVDSIADGDTTRAPSRNAVFDALALKANLESPTFTGDPKAPTPLTADNDTSIATTAFVKNQGYLPSSSYTAADVLAKIITVDGSGSGLDADTIDGIDSTRIPYGANGTATSTVTDLNTPTKSGFYERSPGGGVGNSANGIDTWNWFLHTEHTSGGWGWQLSNIIGTEDLYFRKQEGGGAGTFGSWRKIPFLGMTNVGFFDISGVYRTRGVSSGVEYFDRDGVSATWTTYAQSGSFRLYNGADRVTVASNGDMGINGVPSFNAKLSVHNPSGSQTSMLMWQAGIGASQIGYLAGDTKFYLRNCNVDGLLANGKGINISTAGDVQIDLTAGFGSRLGQHLNLYSNLYGFGIQNNTMYTRAGVGGGFAWFQGGVHNDAQNNPGAGGAVLATLSSTGSFGATTLGVTNALGGYFSGNGGGTQCTGNFYMASGDNYILWASATDWVRIPRTFVQAGDPGAAASDGDLWAW